MLGATARLYRDYVAPSQGGEGIKLEQQYLVSDSAPEVLRHYPMDFVCQRPPAQQLPAYQFEIK